MRHKKITAGALSALALALLLAGCGGGSGDPAPPVDNNPAPNPGGAQGNLININQPVDPADIPQPEPVLAALDDAPLGVNPLYDVTPAAAGIEVRSVSRSTSALSQGQNFRMDWVAICANGAEPDGAATGQLFKEGDSVDLWMSYEVAAGAEFSRTWEVPAFGLSFREDGVSHSAAGTYMVKLDLLIPYGSSNSAARFTGRLVSAGGTSAVVIIDDGSGEGGDGEGNSGEDFDEAVFAVEQAATMPPIYYPEDPDDENDQQGGGGGCIPVISVQFSGISITTTSSKDLSNVVVQFADGKRQKFDNLNLGKTGTFKGTGSNKDKIIVKAWIKSGCNQSGDGPGYGEPFVPNEESLGMAQMCWEDLIVNSDYDYNDFVGRLRATEIRNTSNQLVQVHLTVKAVARGAGYDADWQFNVDAAFPGASVIAIVDQFYANGQRHGEQRIWTSQNGASIPIFSPTRDALPNPPDHSFATNVVEGTTFVDGDYAEVTVILNQPLSQGSYTAIPYQPELKVYASGGNVYTIGLWRKKGDSVDSSGRPLAFIVPDTYSWPMEGKPIWNVYSGFNGWISWINSTGGTAPSPHWYDRVPTADYFTKVLFK